MLSGNDLERLLQGSMAARHICPHCQTSNSFEEGVALALKNGIKDKVLMCKNCQKVFEPNPNHSDLGILSALLGINLDEAGVCDKCHEHQGAVVFSWVEGDVASNYSSRYTGNGTVTTTTTTYDNFRNTNEYICADCFKKAMKDHAGELLLKGIFSLLPGLIPAYYLPQIYLRGFLGIQNGFVITAIVFVVASILGFLLAWGFTEIAKRTEVIKAIAGLLLGINALAFGYYLLISDTSRNRGDSMLSLSFYGLLIWLFLWGLYTILQAITAYRLASAENPDRSEARRFQAIFHPIAKAKIQERRKNENSKRDFVCWTQQEFEENRKRLQKNVGY